MEPIIAPSTFYWIEMISNLRFFITLFCAFSFVGFAVCLIILMILILEDEFKSYAGKIAKKACKSCAILTFIFGLLFIFIPARETMIAMTVAQYVTPNNIEAIGGTVEDGVSYITSEIVQVIEAANNKEAAGDKEVAKSD